jgi:Zn-dependent protease/pSer/pThr/pTyr-binding forkhead associated (FHA) protein
MRAYLEIPEIGGIIELSSKIDVFYIGKDEIKSVASKPLADPSAYDSISRVHKDASGKTIKEHFIIYNNHGKYSIEDKHSTNGTFVGSVSLKGKNSQPLKNGDKIILPVQSKGKLVSLNVIFHLTNETEPESIPESIESPDYVPLQNSGKASTPSVSYNATPVQPEYNEIPSSQQRMYSSSSSVNASQKYTNPAQDADADADQVDRSGSFILVQQAMQIPPNAFRPDSGVDLSIVYRLEKSEIWHILTALGYLFLMVFHTFINIMIITYLVYWGTGSLPTGSTVLPRVLSDFLVDPTVFAFIFAVAFVCHELSHLYTGKHFGYQSRFCLTKVGIKMTKKAAAIGLPFGLPGAAVSIGVDPVNDKDKMGWIKTMGPSANFFLGLIFLIVSLIIPNSLLTVKTFLAEGSTLNFLLGIFNLMPFAVKGFALDGEFIIKWKKLIYFSLLALSIIGILISVSITQNLAMM